ncbi:P-loop containing nucleoside triphosphate hydrolase protein [Russula brevipes]|nr:P-loop containing nucleoside triphosphate hydrolase protein [Russula brevipes]
MTAQFLPEMQGFAVHTCEEKIQRDYYDEKRWEPEGVVEVEEAHGGRWIRSAAERSPTLGSLGAQRLLDIGNAATMYHLLKGLHEYLTRKDEFSVIIIGLDGAGKTTLLERIKTMYNDTPGLPPDKIAPTVGQNTGKISLPSALLQFWDLGGQRGIRSIWPKYYDDCHAVVYVVDAVDHERLSEGWEAFDTVLSAPQILGVPLLLLANKQDSPGSLSVADVRHDYEVWYQHKIESARRREGNEMDSEQRRERIASLDVMGLSALEGTGVRAIVDWLFIRVQNSKRRDES